MLLLWNGNLFNVNVLDLHERYFHCQFLLKSSGISWYVTFVYQYPHKHLHRQIWDILLSIPVSLTDPMGDFNCILHLLVKQGGLRSTNRFMLQFRDFFF